jgi:hypothetical protein
MRKTHGRRTPKPQISQGIRKDTHYMGKRQAIRKYLPKDAKGKEPEERGIRQSILHDSRTGTIPLTLLRLRPQKSIYEQRTARRLPWTLFPSRESRYAA